MEPAALLCELEYQEADAATGRNRVTIACASAALARRRSGVEVVSLAPAAPLRKAIKLQSPRERYELYFRFAKDGKISFIRRDATRIYQFNVRGADPLQLVALVKFCLRLGAQPKSPLASLDLALPPPPPAASTAKRARRYDDDDDHHAAVSTRRPLSDRSNLSAQWASPPPLSPQAKRRRRLDAMAAASSSSRSTPSPTTNPLTVDQKRVLALIAARRNVFFTGSAGTGKSFLLQQILAPDGPLRDFVRGKRVFATATTGIAAYNIGGMTLHHFAGLDTRVVAADDGDAGLLAAQIKRKKDALQRWNAADVLVIDEISMLDGRLFDLLEQLARELRPQHRNQFFGGIQLVLSGDFFQLPPVGSRDAAAPPLCFESIAWQRGVRDVVELTQVFRQTNSEFIDILNALRVGTPTHAMIARLNQQYREEDHEDGDAIRIFTHNKDVVETNSKRLDALAGRKFNYVSADSGRKDFLASCPAPPTLSLKKNARVMLIKSINPASGLVNGCRGVIVAFSPQTNLPVVKFANGSTHVVGQEDFPVRVADAVLATRRQLPLALAWAISIHKSQGLAFPSAVLDLSRVFEFGQAYVALSRVRSLEGLTLKRRLDERRLLLADQRVLRFYDNIRQR